MRVTPKVMPSIILVKVLLGGRQCVENWVPSNGVDFYKHGMQAFKHW